MWMVAFSNVLSAHGLERIIPYAFSCSAIAAFISPLIAGSLADQHFSAERLLRWFACAAAVSLALTFVAIGKGWGAAWVLIFLQIQALCSSPTWGLASTIVLTNLNDPAREFGPVRVWATIGWMLAGWVTSYALQADASVRSGLAASVVWLGVAAITFYLPKTAPPVKTAGRTWSAVLGLEALQLLRHREHGPVLIAAALVSVPLAAFYPFAALHLRDLGEHRVAAVMSLGQVSEIITMYAISPLLARVRLKWLLLAGIAFGVVRYALFTANSLPTMFAGIALHGVCYTLFFIPAQIYLDRRVERHLHARAQALLTLMVAGLGTLAGSLGCGWLRQACTDAAGTSWGVFWALLCGAMVVVFGYFALAYRAEEAGAETASAPALERVEP